jgi:lysophospholipase L1-like esterase
MAGNQPTTKRLITEAMLRELLPGVLPDELVTQDELDAALDGLAQGGGLTPAALADALKLKQDQHREHQGLRSIIVGDSIAKGSDGLTNGHSGSWFSYVAGLSFGAIRMVRNAGVAGNTSAQMLARYAADVLVHRPELIVIEAITPNDTPARTTNEAIRANIKSMVEQGLAIGARVIVCTGPPQADDTVNARMIENSAWLRTYAALLGLDVWDLNEPLVNPATGKYKDGYSGDGTHPTRDACDVLAKAVWGKASNDFLPGGILATASDTDNILGDRGLFLAADAAATVADGVVAPNAATGATVARTARDDGLGFWQSLTNTAAGPALQIINLGGVKQADNSWALLPWMPGDVFAFSGEYENISSTTGFTAQVNMQVSTNGTAGTAQFRAISDWNPTLKGRRSFYIEDVVPDNYVPAATNVAIVLGAGTGTVRYSRIRLVNLSALERARKLSGAVAAALKLKADADKVYSKAEVDAKVAAASSPIRLWNATTRAWPAIGSTTQPVIFMSTNDKTAPAPTDMRIDLDVWMPHVDSAIA